MSTEKQQDNRRDLITLALILGMFLAGMWCMGCSGSMATKQVQQTAEHSNKPQVTLSTTPYIEVVGDQQAVDLVAYANSQGNSLWKCSTCAVDQQSGTTLSLIPQVIANHPNLVVINTGAADFIQNPMQEHDEATVQNVIAMQDDLTAAGIKSVIMILPYSTAYDEYYDNVVYTYEYEAGVIINIFGSSELYGEGSDPGDGPFATEGANADWTQSALVLLYPELWNLAETLGAGGGAR